MDRKLISFDWAIKKILRNKANFNITEGFLSELLREDIKIIEILESESNKDHEQDKYNRVDMLVKNSKDELIIIEIQNERQLDYLHRIQFGTAKVMIEHMVGSVEYSRIKKVISINILYFDIGHGTDYVYHGTTQFVGMHNKEILALDDKQKVKFKVKEVKDIFPEYYLLKVNNFDDVAKDTLDEWIYFFKNSAVKDTFHAKGIKEAGNALDVAKMSQEERKAYNRKLEIAMSNASWFDNSYGDGLREGEEKGLVKGRTEGLEQGKRDSAKAMLAENMSLEAIARCTGLSIVDIEKLNK
jgi:predicted transposase/invertase (TIGR01784 family)